MSAGKLKTKRRNDATVAFQNEVLTRTKLHTEMVHRLINDPSVQPSELAGFLEDVANAYLSMSEELSQCGKEGQKK